VAAEEANEPVLTVTRDGHRIGELIPPRRRRRLVPRQEFTAMSLNAHAVVWMRSGPTRMRRSIMKLAARMSGEQLRQGMLDTYILIPRRWVDPADLPDEMAISAITLAELAAGPHEVRGNDEQDAYDERAERRPWKAMSAASASRLPHR
jgi:hypothetical protein